MLDAFIIEELKRREREKQRHERERPSLEVPLDPSDDDRPPKKQEQERPQRGVVTFDV